MLTQAQRSFLRQSAVQAVNAGRTYRLFNTEQRDFISSLITLGDAGLSGASVRTSGGEIVVRRSNAKATKVTTQTTSGAVTRTLGEKGLTIPKGLLEEIRVNGAAAVYLRPLSDNSFLVMRTKGTNGATVRYPLYSDGRCVITRTALGTLLNRTVNGGQFRIEVYGQTENTIRVTRS